MKVYLQCFVLVVLLYASPLYGIEPEKDTISTVLITDFEQIDEKTVTFTLGVVRNSESWRTWGNGTYQLTIAGMEVSPENQEISFIGGSELPLEPSLGQAMKGYHIAVATLKGRMSITIIGPGEYSDARTIGDVGNMLILGKFQIKIIKGSSFLNPELITWYKPNSHFQAHAFKRETDSIENGIQWYAANDNVEMENITTAVRYAINLPSIKPTNDIDFIATYRGGGRVDLQWKTTHELFNRGFILRRGLRSADETMPFVFTEEIGNYTKALTNPALKDVVLISKSTRGEGMTYEFIDIVPERGEQYLYELTDISSAESILAQNPGIHDRDTAGVIIPVSVISSAVAGPNPFTSKTTVTYFVETPSYISIKVTNILGKEVIILLDNVRQESGEYKADFQVDELASNGLYNIIIIATPIEEAPVDNNVKETRVSIGVQLIR